jgi:hypothetical protein
VNSEPINPAAMHAAMQITSLTTFDTVLFIYLHYHSDIYVKT